MIPVSTNVITVIMALTLSSSSVNYIADYSNEFIPSQTANYEWKKDFTDWNNDNFFTSDLYSNNNSELKNFSDLVIMSHTLIQNSKDLDSDLIELINKKFWDLV